MSVLFFRPVLSVSAARVANRSGVANVRPTRCAQREWFDGRWAVAQVPKARKKKSGERGTCTSECLCAFRTIAHPRRMSRRLQLPVTALDLNRAPGLAPSVDCARGVCTILTAQHAIQFFFALFTNRSDQLLRGTARAHRAHRGTPNCL